MATRTEASNLAIRHLGSGKVIENVETERSQEARSCRDFLDIAIEDTLREFAWPLATSYVGLALVSSRDEDDDHPTDDWAYAYRYPANCAMIRRILNGQSRIEAEDTKIPYKIGRDDEGRLVFTDQEDAQVEFTWNLTDIEEWTSDMILALSYRLGYLIAPSITGGDPYKAGDRCLTLFRQMSVKAQANSENEQQKDQRPDSDFIRVRE